jgi:hypothetical protein
MSAYGGHPDRAAITAYLARTGGAADRLWVGDHVESCNSCYRIMAEERLPRPGRISYSPAFARAAAPIPIRAREPGGVAHVLFGWLLRKLRLRPQVPQPAASFPRTRRPAASPAGAR